MLDFVTAVRKASLTMCEAGTREGTSKAEESLGRRWECEDVGLD